MLRMFRRREASHLDKAHSSQPPATVLVAPPVSQTQPLSINGSVGSGSTSTSHTGAQSSGINISNPSNRSVVAAAGVAQAVGTGSLLVALLRRNDTDKTKRNSEHGEEADQLLIHYPQTPNPQTLLSTRLFGAAAAAGSLLPRINAEHAPRPLLLDLPSHSSSSLSMATSSLDYPTHSVLTLSLSSLPNVQLLVAHVLMADISLAISIPATLTSQDSLRRLLLSLAALMQFIVPRLDRIGDEATLAAAHSFCSNIYQYLRRGHFVIPLSRLCVAAHCVPGTRLAPVTLGQLSKILDSLEAWDRGIAAEASGNQDVYICIGSCVLQSGAFIHGTMSPHLHGLISEYCTIFDFLGTAAASAPEHLVVWREVSLPEHLTEAHTFSQVSGKKSSTAQPRHALVCVAADRTILCAVLETALFLELEDTDHVLTADTSFIFEMKRVLTLLKSEGIDSQMEVAATGCASPAVAAVETFLSGGTAPADARRDSSISKRDSTISKRDSISSNTNRRDSLNPPRPHSTGGRRTSTPNSRESLAGRIQSLLGTPKGSSLSDVPAIDDDEVPPIVAATRRHSVTSNNDVVSSKQHRWMSEGPINLSEQRRKLTAGISNVLFECLSFDSTLGTILYPALPKNYGSLHELVLDSFRLTVLTMRSTLQKMIRRQQPIVSNGFCELAALLTPDTSSSTGKSKKTRKSQLLKYWVIGRMTPDTEFYVCIHESVPQSMIELCFKAYFGLTL